MTITCELRDKWAAALRSGRYEQGRGALQKEGRYCCLGVLAGVAKRIEDHSKGRVYYNIESDTDGKWTCVGFPAALAGLDDAECLRFIRMNDDKNKGFSEIATEVDALQCDE